MRRGPLAHEEASTAHALAAADAALTKLLDHIAVELAAEYVRLMETAAEQEALQGGSATKSTEGAPR